MERLLRGDASYGLEDAPPLCAALPDEHFELLLAGCERHDMLGASRVSSHEVVAFRSRPSSTATWTAAFRGSPAHDLRLKRLVLDAHEVLVERVSTIACSRALRWQTSRIPEAS